MFRKFLCFCSVIVLSAQTLWATPLPDISADGAILIDAKTNVVLYSKNANQAFYPASTTKILTSLVILNDLSLDQVITKSQESVNAVPSDSSQIGLNVGDQYSVYDGLHAVLMASDNFVCHDLAIQDAGTINNFAQRMNNFALAVNANNYNFVNSHGYHNINHYCSPYSLAKIAESAFSNPVLTEIAGTYQYNFTVLNRNKTIPLTHTALLLNPSSPYYNSHVVAAKTGFHDEAQRTLVAKAVYGDMELIGVVMRTTAPHQFEDMNNLFKYGSENFELITNSEVTTSENTTRNDVENTKYTLVNNTYSPWAKPYITEALNNGWITNTTYNYMSPITTREFLSLLRTITPAKYNDAIDAKIHYNGPSIYKENLPATRSEIASITYDFLNNLDLILLPQELQLTDLESLSVKDKEAAYFCVSSGLMSAVDDTFLPHKILTYEQALCLISRINSILTRYKSYGI